MGVGFPIVLGVSEPLQVHVNPMISEPTGSKCSFCVIGTLLFRPLGKCCGVVSFIDAIAEAIRKDVVPERDIV